MDYDPYGNTFMIKAKQTVFKWWYVIYKPVYKLMHNGDWPAEKQQKYEARTGDISNNSTDTEAKNIQNEQLELLIENNSNQHNIDVLIANNITTQSTDETEPDLSNVSADTLNRANEILERLAREAAEDEAKKQAEIDEAKRKADEEQRLASIMKANEIDISPYIEEGKAHQKAIQEDKTE